MKKEMNKMDIQAKMDVLKELYEMCSEKLGDKVEGGLKGLKSVTVAAPDSESLHEGLEMAQEMAPEMEEKSEEESTAEMSEGGPDMETEDEDEDTGSFFNNMRKKRFGKDT